MAKIYIVLTDSGTVPGKLVRLVTHFPYCHVMLSFHKNCSVTYGFGRRGVYNPLNGGFVVQQWDGPFFTHFSDTVCQVLGLTVTREQLAQLQTYLQPFLSHPEMYSYDFAGVILRYLGFQKTFPRRYVCSHFVAEALQKAGICAFPQGAEMVRPEDFLKIPGVSQVYVGKWRDIPRECEEEIP